MRRRTIYAYGAPPAPLQRRPRGGGARAGRPAEAEEAAERIRARSYARCAVLDLRQARRSFCQVEATAAEIELGQRSEAGGRCGGYVGMCVPLRFGVTLY
jgi:hypothetical protein